MKKHSIMHSFVQYFVVLLAFLFTLSGCKDEFKPEESFIKVYDDSDLNRSYFPLSMERTSDNGYFILSAYNGSNIHLLKIDELGDLLWEFDLPSQYISAAPNLIERNGSLYFVCMDAVGLFTYIMEVDETAQNAGVFQTFQNIKYPLSVTDNENAVYIQNYKRTTFKTGIYELTGEMDQILDSGDVQIFVDVEEKITDHLNYTGERLPFFVSVTPEDDYVILNGFNNYSFSSVFLDPNLDFAGVYNGAAFDGGLNAILPLGGNQFSLSRFSFSDLYLNPNATLDPTTVDIAESIPATWNSELDVESPVLIKSVSINSSDYAVYLATTKSNQLVLSFYVKGTDELAGSKYLGESVPLRACDFSKTSDGGMMILTQVTVMSSFNRIATIKLSKEELESLVE